MDEKLADVVWSEKERVFLTGQRLLGLWINQRVVSGDRRKARNSLSTNHSSSKMPAAQQKSMKSNATFALYLHCDVRVLRVSASKLNAGLAV